ncbi:hypothetical protein Nepgr_001945 [Nepenthes gracilis]|uniref:Thioredoxin domain-containing protein n=1 Tax=Nepenthes gracilis TaxID=150966 RepID=A0AAD3P5Z0_NEPGR|nr:hypothetical protein Nepgr_001945 [Nepenthes gracilis]
MCLFTASYSIRFVSPYPLACDTQSDTFIHDLQLECPLSISSAFPVEMNGDLLEQALRSKQMIVYTAVLFYASWCPFSNGIRYKFDVLSSMFPQIGHIAVEQSSAMPSVFSRYGIHSLPALLMVNQTAKMRYYGPQDLRSVAHFYKRTTGIDPIEDVIHQSSSRLMSAQKALQPSYQSSWDEMIVKEPYLVFAVLFLMLRSFLYFCPGMMYHLSTVWFLYKQHLNLGIFGESSRLLGHVLHFDVTRMRSKLKLCKSGNFHRGARNARVWASSLASVSLGETSSARSPSSSTDS